MEAPGVACDSLVVGSGCLDKIQRLQLLLHIYHGVSEVYPLDANTLAVCPIAWGAKVQSLHKIGVRRPQKSYQKIVRRCFEQCPQLWRSVSEIELRWLTETFLWRMPCWVLMERWGFGVVLVGRLQKENVLYGNRLMRLLFWALSPKGMTEGPDWSKMYTVYTSF